MGVKKEVDIYIECDVCRNQGVRPIIRGDNAKHCRALAKAEGWRISGTLAICPDCRMDRV